jgi:hypothetical protein
LRSHEYPQRRNHAALIQKFLVDVEVKGNQREERFADFVDNQYQNAESVRPFLFPCGIVSREDWEIERSRACKSQELDDCIGRLREREKNLSERLTKVKGQIFVLESERRAIRQ